MKIDVNIVYGTQQIYPYLYLIVNINWLINYTTILN